MNKDTQLLAEAYTSILEGKKDNKGKDIHIINALKAEIKVCKSASEKKKLEAKLAKYEADLVKEDFGPHASKSVSTIAPSTKVSFFDPSINDHDHGTVCDYHDPVVPADAKAKYDDMIKNNGSPVIIHSEDGDIHVVDSRRVNPIEGKKIAFKPNI